MPIRRASSRASWRSSARPAAPRRSRARSSSPSFDNLKRREAGNFFATDRLRPVDQADPDSFKVRRGTVGGWRDYFDAAQRRSSTRWSRGSCRRRWAMGCHLIRRSSGTRCPLVDGRLGREDVAVAGREVAHDRDVGVGVLAQRRAARPDQRVLAIGVAQAEIEAGQDEAVVAPQASPIASVNMPVEGCLAAISAAIVGIVVAQRAHQLMIIGRGAHHEALVAIAQPPQLVPHVEGLQAPLLEVGEKRA